MFLLLSFTAVETNDIRKEKFLKKALAVAAITAIAYLKKTTSTFFEYGLTRAALIR